MQDVLDGQAACGVTPFLDIGQPCGGMECDGLSGLCDACELSYRDHYDSLRPS